MLEDLGSRIVVLLGLEDRRNLRRGFGRARRRFGRDLMSRLRREGFQLHLQVVVFFRGDGLLLVLRARRGCKPLGRSWRLLGFVG
jgi:hypothetical protein